MVERPNASTATLEPIGVRLECPACQRPHVCGSGIACYGLRHRCGHIDCGNRWKPFVFPVVARGPHDELTDAVVCYAEHGEDGYDGVGFYWYDAEYPEEGASGAYLTLQEAAQAAMENDYWRVRFDPDALKAATGEVPDAG